VKSNTLAWDDLDGGVRNSQMPKVARVEKELNVNEVFNNLDE